MFVDKILNIFVDYYNTYYQKASFIIDFKTVTFLKLINQNKQRKHQIS